MTHGHSTPSLVCIRDKYANSDYFAPPLVIHKGADFKDMVGLRGVHLAGVNYLDRPATTILAGWKRGMISL